MSTRSKMAAWLLCASTSAVVGCSPEEVYLEADAGAQDEDLEAAEPSGCWMIVMQGGSRSGEVTVTPVGGSGRPSSSSTLSDGKDDPSAGVSAGGSGCGDVGAHEVSVSINGRTVLEENIIVPADKQSIVLVYAHGARAPRISVSEVDLSPAAPGLRRARVTNYVEVVEPIQLFYYDADDEPVGESESIAWGETWTGTIPTAATGYRLSRTDAVATAFERVMWSHPPTAAELPCVEAPPLGLVVIGTYMEGGAMVGGKWYEWRGAHHAEERYTYLPPVCFVE